MGRKRSLRGSPNRSAITKYPTATTIAGQRRQVWEGRAEQTKGGLTRKDLMENKSGKIVSRRASRASKKTFEKNGLAAHSYRSATTFPSSTSIDWIDDM